jgi:hypothetical protein
MDLTPSLRANGSRECAPDDRLREAIHLTACGGMDCFAALAMTVEGASRPHRPGREPRNPKDRLHFPQPDSPLVT